MYDDPFSTVDRFKPLSTAADCTVTEGDALSVSVHHRTVSRGVNAQYKMRVVD